MGTGRGDFLRNLLCDVRDHQGFLSAGPYHGGATFLIVDFLNSETGVYTGARRPADLLLLTPVFFHDQGNTKR